MNYGALSSIPRETTIGGQPHMLAYINPEEESLIQDYRGNLPPVAGPDGVPAYFFFGGSSGWGGGGGSSSSSSSNDDDDDDGGGIFSSIGNAISSVGSAISNTVSSAVDFVSDAGSAAVETISNVASNIGSAAADTVTEIVTLGSADTDTYNPGATTDTTSTATTDTATADTTTADTAVGEFIDSRGISHPTAAARDAANAQYAAEEAAENDNTVIESIANFFTPGDGTTYIDSVLVPDDVGIEATVGANPGSSYDAETGKIIGSDGSTIKIGTNVNADDITSSLYAELLPGGSAGSYEDFITRYDTTAAAAALDPYGSTTATGFIVNEGFTADLDGDGVSETYESGGSYTVNTDGSVVVAGSEGDTTGGLSLLGESLIDLDLADEVNEDGSNITGGMTDLTDLGGGDEDGIFGGEGVTDSIFTDSGAEPYSRDIYGTRDIMGDFYGGRSGGMWDRFIGSYLTRFGYSPEQFDEMVRKVENPDGTTSFFGADGALINPESIGSNYRLTGDPTVLKIGEEQVAIGSQDYDAQGNLISTNYTDAYNPDLDADILAQNQVYSVTDPASGQLVTFPNQAQYDQFVAANNAALTS